MRRTLITNRARAMRKAMTEPEVMPWNRLRGRGPHKPIFRRQHPFGGVILDFYCPAARLAVEVDGATHGEEAAQTKDEGRRTQRGTIGWRGRASAFAGFPRRGSITTSAVQPTRC